MTGVKRLAALIVFLFAFSIYEVRSQTVCSQVLAEAQQDFDQGHFYGIAGKLKDCIDGGFNKAQKIEAYKLLTITYLYIDDPIGAESSYLELLKLDPEHNVDPSIDPIEVVYLNEKFTTTPFFTIQVFKAGVNYTKPLVINNYGADNTSMTNEKYEGNVGYTFGAGIDYNLSDYFSLGLELSFERRSYSYSNIVFQNDPQGYRENLLGLSVPLFLRFTYPGKKWYPYIYGGYALKVNLASRFTDLNLNNVTPAKGDTPKTEQQVNVPDLTDATDLRNTLNTALVAGIGVKYRLNYEYISFDIRLDAGMLNHTNEDKRFLLTNENPTDLQEPSTIPTTLGIVMDDIRINDLSFTVGFVKPLYKPRKKVSGVKGIRKLFKRN